jgi:ubiquinone/menaquinone biosynthesis C-methylase UbiE
VIEPESEARRAGRFIPALQFRGLTPIYDFVIRLTMREDLLRQLHIEYMQLAPGQSVLDIGCGTGTLAIRIKEAEPGVKIVGLDPDPQILRIAMAKAHRASAEVGFKRGSAESMPFEDATFDVVVSSLAFHHLPRGVKRTALKETIRVLKPGGRLLIADFGPPRTRIGLLTTLSIRLLDGGSTTRDNFLGRLPAMAEAVGFSDVAEAGRMRTVFGPVCFYAATRPTGDPAGAGAT